ncbi:MAG: hypothetical protein IKN65_06595 [Clostridia bacterium]|nr:hypothetical protein [Clostridia bacterium]
MNNNSIRQIPEEDMISSPWNGSLFGEYQDGVFCFCGNIIKFKNRKPHETVIIKCPKCNRGILYG